MPKTSVDENDFTSVWEHDVGAAGKIAPVKSVPEADREHQPPDQQFRFRVRRAHPAHPLASLIWR